jgi:hypothetical protein
MHAPTQFPEAHYNSGVTWANGHRRAAHKHRRKSLASTLVCRSSLSIHSHSFKKTVCVYSTYGKETHGPGNPLDLHLEELEGLRKR